MLRWNWLVVFVFTVVSCTHSAPLSLPGTDKPEETYLMGRLAIIQGPTSDKETLINVLVPRLKDYKYEVQDQNGNAVSADKYETITAPIVHYKIDKIHVRGLTPQSTYTLAVKSEFRGKTSTIDQRTFRALDIRKSELRFAALSCMADDWKFETVIDPMWERLKKENPDLVILNGDIVYVDSFDYVERTNVLETDLWLRYIDTLKRLPYYHWLELKPTLATWDDHDFGTNDSDRTFKSKAAALKLFKGLFGGRPIKGVWEPGPSGVTSVFTGFGQRFFLMDDRTFRQPNKEQKQKEPYGHWGEQQHQWLISSLKASTTPAWIFNGNQLFNGKALNFKETFEGNHTGHFSKLMNDLKKVPTSVVFASGDIHFSEVMRIPKERLGYDTYEITSSSMHSYRGSGWENPMRVQGASTLEYNFLVMTASAKAKGFDIHVKSVGLAPESYFEIPLKVEKN